MKREKVLSWLKETVESAVIAFFIAFVIIIFVVQSFWIPSGSMEPNFYRGDRISAYKLFYGINNVKRGDVIIFKFPLDPSKNYIKRAIGLPGDEIDVRDKKVYVNGKLLNEPYVVHKNPLICKDPLYKRNYISDQYGPIKVPPDYLFMMGDNRDDSWDSRFWGFVPAENIVGEAFLRYWPPWRIKIIRGFSH
ncbi:signal peptidase I [Candidatus Aerophobetes bacterium]|nr:signal peptidase I [Candidatus Aerophobetes bacterium]